MWQPREEVDTERASVVVRLQICILEVLGSNLRRNTGYPERVFLTLSMQMLEKHFE
jgi:hypothetical protein